MTTISKRVRAQIGGGAVVRSEPDGVAAERPKRES